MLQLQLCRLQGGQAEWPTGLGRLHEQEEKEGYHVRGVIHQGKALVYFWGLGCNKAATRQAFGENNNKSQKIELLRQLQP